MGAEVRVSPWRGPGHRHLPDGELLRLDSERGGFVASEYWPNHSERRHVRGSFDQVASVLELWELEVGS